jgi:hypothetical protein
METILREKIKFDNPHITLKKLTNGGSDQHPYPIFVIQYKRSDNKITYYVIMLLRCW